MKEFRQVMNKQSALGRWLTIILNPWVIGGSLLFAIFLCAITYGLVLLTRQPSLQSVPATAVLNIIQAPTAIPTNLSPSLAASPTITSEIPPAPPEGVIGIGAYVQVTNTGGDGLRLRQEPGLGGQILMLGSEAEVFRVIDGPREIDGYTWWLLVGPFDESRKGWAVSNYLVIVQNP